MALTYAALISLMNTLTRFQLPTCPVSFDQSQLRSLSNKVSSLVDFIEAYSQKISNDLLRRMADVAFEAEDMIESYYVDRVLEEYKGNSIITGKDYVLFCQDMEEAICRMNMILEKSMEIAEKTDVMVQLSPQCSVRAGSVAPDEKVKIVGLDQELLCLMDQLSSDKSSRQIIPVVGMGGIGKTTLARHVYDHPYVKHHFHIQAWVTISQSYTVGKILASLLDTHDESKSPEDLGEQLYKSLWGRKYLIILDDIWDDLAWGEIRRFLPDNNNGSRVLLTTRILSVAISLGSCDPHEIKLLGDKESWDLLSQTIFRQEVCPPELVECGEKIAKGCKGLPLAITTVGGLLKKSIKKLEYWEEVAENVNSFINVQNESHCLEILSLSYNELPIYLKPCLLYLATLKEDQEMGVFWLINLWVANGFLKPNKDKTLEEVGLQYLNHLVDRNLIRVKHDLQVLGFETLSFHGLLHEFCLREATNRRFLYNVKKEMVYVPQILDSERHLVCRFHIREINPFPSVPLVRSSTYHSSGLLDLTFYTLLRVLATNRTTKLTSRTPLANIRYLAYKFERDSLPGFFAAPSLLWHLETLDICGWFDVVLPSVFWELPNLRHLVSTSEATIILPDPTDAQDKCVLNNLQSLGHIQNFNLNIETLEKIPEVKKLEITYNGDFCLGNSERLASCFTNLALLLNLEILFCSFMGYCFSDLCVFKETKNLAFSPNLRVLGLYGCCIPWEDMTVIGSLPFLESLSLDHNAFCGGVWNSTEGEFLCLKYLEIKGCDLRIWRAESTHFPRLEELKLWCMELEEIAQGIADIVSLRKIAIKTNKMSVVISAKDILDERENQGDDGLLIEVQYLGKTDGEELDNLASDRFQVEVIVI